MTRRHPWKQRLEAGFGRYGNLAFARPWQLLFVLTVGVASLASQLPTLRVDTTIEGFLSPNDPEIVQYEFFRKKFGRDEFIMVAFEPENLFDLNTLHDLRGLQEAIETTLPHVWEVNSILSARNVYGRGDDLIVEDLFATFPDSASQVARIREIALSNPLYRNSLITEDGTFTAMTVKLVPYYRLPDPGPDGEPVYEYLADVQLIEAMDALYAILEQFPELNRVAHISGTTALTAEISRAINTDFRVFSVAAISIIAVILLLIFRRPAAVILPLSVMIVSTVITISLMAITDTAIQMTTSILPSFLLAVCIGDSVHLLSVFFRRFDESGDREAAMVHALQHAGVAMMFTSLTTAAGLGSFATADITPIANLGVFGAVGSLVAFLVTILLLPVLVGVAGVSRRELPEKNTVFLSDRFAHFSTRLATRHAHKVLLAAALLFACSLFALKDIRYSHNAIKWFEPDNPFRMALEYIESRLKGTLAVEVLIDTGKQRGVVEPEFLRALDAVLHELETTPSPYLKIGKAYGFPTLVKETHRAIQGNDPAAYSIPDDPNLIAQLLLLVELDAGDELFKLIDGQYRWARATVLIPWTDAVYYEAFLHDLDRRLQAALGDHADVSITGMTPILGRTFSQMLRSTGRSYLIAGGVITLMMILLLGSVHLGLISMIPNLLPIIVVIAFMALVGAPLDMFSMLIGSIAIGLTVDDTVHFMHGFRRHYALTGRVAESIEATLVSTGRALVVTTIVLACGFSVYLLSAMNNMDDFGRLTAVCVTLALLADFWLAPALMMVLFRDRDPENVEGPNGESATNQEQ